MIHGTLWSNIFCLWNSVLKRTADSSHPTIHCPQTGEIGFVWAMWMCAYAHSNPLYMMDIRAPVIKSQLYELPFRWTSNAKFTVIEISVANGTLQVNFGWIWSFSVSTWNGKQSLSRFYTCAGSQNYRKVPEKTFAVYITVHSGYWQHPIANIHAQLIWNAWTFVWRYGAGSYWKWSVICNLRYSNCYYPDWTVFTNFTSEIGLAILLW